MSAPPKNRFSSKWAMILTCMGMAVGTGNIWRFPREVAKNGGGSFLIPWIIFLFLWSVPLLMVELSVGQSTRKGPFGAFNKLAGKNWAWMGGFISLCSMMIMCYYAVVTGWTFKYVFYAISGALSDINHEAAVALFNGFRSTPQSLIFHVLAVFVAAHFVNRGSGGIEKLNKILIPALILILVYGAIKSLTLTGSGAGLSYFFSVDTARLTKPEHWIAGLTQSAWSTGAGWGLMLAYAVYARDNEDPVTTPMATGLGNNSIELFVGLMLFPAVFALMGDEAVGFVSGSHWKGGIAFQSAPLLFAQMPGGNMVSLLFFLGLAFAALTSLVSMLELSTRFFSDFGIPRQRALFITMGMCLVLGAPSALSDKIFDNQDFVWGVGLIISGMFLAVLVLKYGTKRFCEDILNRNASIIRGGLWFRALMILVLVEGAVLLGWWLKAAGDMTLVYWCLGQWALVILVLFLLRHKLNGFMAAQAGEQ